MLQKNEQDFNPAFTNIRRAKKAVQDEEWIKSFLRQAASGVLATVYQDQPFLSPKLFVYDEQQHAIFLHSANEGRVWENVHLNPKACFTTYTMGRMSSAKKARSFGVEYQSVIVFGKISIVEDIQEIIAVLRLFMEKYAPHLRYGEDYAEIVEQDLDGLALYRMEITGWSAKQDQAEPNFPGAYRYEDFDKS